MSENDEFSYLSLTNMTKDKWLMTKLQIMMIPTRTRCLRHDIVYINTGITGCPECFEELRQELTKLTW